MQNKRSKKLIIATAIICIIAVSVVTGWLVRTNAKSDKVSELLSLGDRYLEALEYEKALVAYNTAIQIDEKNVEAYIKLADTYTEIGAYDTAVRVLKTAYSMTDSSKIENYYEEYIDEYEKLITESTKLKKDDISVKYEWKELFGDDSEDVIKEAVKEYKKKEVSEEQESTEAENMEQESTEQQYTEQQNMESQYTQQQDVEQKTQSITESETKILSEEVFTEESISLIKRLAYAFHMISYYTDFSKTEELYSDPAKMSAFMGWYFGERGTHVGSNSVNGIYYEIYLMNQDELNAEIEQLFGKKFDMHKLSGLSTYYGPLYTYYENDDLYFNASGIGAEEWPENCEILQESNGRWKADVWIVDIIGNGVIASLYMEPADNENGFMVTEFSQYVKPLE